MENMKESFKGSSEKSGNAGFSVSKDEISGNEKYLNFDVKEGPGIRIEPTHLFEKSYFRDNYYDALVLTERIIQENELFTDNPEFAENSQYRLYNIISFMGPRGAGKTSVMDSVVLALRDHNRRNEYISFGKKYLKSFGQGRNEFDLKDGEPFKKLAGTSFICLDEIDASLLEKNENILDVVLAKMLRLFQRKTAQHNRSSWQLNEVSYRKEDIYVTFEDIYHSWHNLLERNQSKRITGSTMEIMRELSGSLRIREKLTSFVRYYNHAISDSLHESRSNKVYMIIRIDDLDLNPDCYEMLEQIHRYLMIPGIIIYFSAASRELQDVCRSHYKDRYSLPEELANAYLDKVLTTSMRVYLPSLINENVYIRPDEADVKKTILWKIGRRTRVFFDGCGYKKHFYEESNLRSLLNLYYEFDSMEKLRIKPDHLHCDENKKRFMLTFERNIAKLYDDVTKRMAMEKLLTEEDRSFFNKYCLEDSARRGRYFIEFLKRTNTLPGLDENEYNYGELMRSIYLSGRENMELKPLIHCILASYTVTLTGLYYRMIFSETEDKCKRFRSKFLECLSGSVIGSWANKLLPQIQGPETKEIPSIGYSDTFELNGDIVLSEVGFSCNDGDRYIICTKLLEDPLINFVQSVELMGMFFTKLQKVDGAQRALLKLTTNNPMNLEQTNIEEKSQQASRYFKTETDTNLQIVIAQRNCTFDILGFVLNGMNAESYFERIEQHITKMFEDYCSESGDKLTQEQIENIIKLIEKHSLRNEYEKWTNEYYGLALPVYSLDMMYNITKRVKTEMKRRKIETNSEEEIISSVRSCYELYLENLIAETKYFMSLSDEKSVTEKNCAVYFDQALSKCPFYVHFMDESKKNKFLRLTFKKIMRGNIEQAPLADTDSSMEEASLADNESGMEDASLSDIELSMKGAF